MRIRRKKNLDARAEKLKNIIMIDRDVTNVNIAILDKRYFDESKVFSNDNALEMEIGCGKGGFISHLAVLRPEVNYYAVEKIKNIIVDAGELCEKNGITNVKFINTGAEYLERYIKDNTIERIYLNFSPPYPKSPYENRRLTNDRYIAIYKKLLVKNGEIQLKTDDLGFFEYSKNKLYENGFKVFDVTWEKEKLICGNIVTEYETMFMQNGKNIYALIAKI